MSETISLGCGDGTCVTDGCDNDAEVSVQCVDAHAALCVECLGRHILDTLEQRGRDGEATTLYLQQDNCYWNQEQLDRNTLLSIRGWVKVATTESLNSALSMIDDLLRNINRKPKG